jgi:hypothetical protein
MSDLVEVLIKSGTILDGTAVARGERVTVSRKMALMLIQNGKAEFAPEANPASQPPEIQEPAVGTMTKKGKKAIG